ncbi:hypothetical protein BsWGS_27076 [Bradybaena similaris]
MNCGWSCQRAILTWFYNYGYFLAEHPLYFLIIPVLICGGLGYGLTTLEPKDGIEYLYAPSHSRSLDEREIVRQQFKDLSDTNYSPFSLNELIPESVIICRSKDKKSILTEKVIKEITSFYVTVVSMGVATATGGNVTFDDICKKQSGACVIKGAFVFDDDFLDKVKAGNVTYPSWEEQRGVDLTTVFANVDVSPSGSLIAAGSLKISFPLRQNQLTKAWESAFTSHIRETQFSTVDIAYRTSNSMNEELDKGTKSDILYFSLTFTFMITFASIVSSGGDAVSSRMMLANAGVFGVVVGIIGAIGVVSLSGVNYVSLVGTMPFLTLGIGVDDMFLLMSSWSETLPLTDLTIPERMATIYRKAGIGITITSVTDFLAFVIGTSSRFRSVRNFCIYTGAGVLMCYFCNACMFGAFMTLHARRVYASQHFITCQKVEKSRQQLKTEGANHLQVHFCGGEIPTTTAGDQSVCEQGPRNLVKYLLWNPVRYLTLLVFAVYLAVAIWGCTQLQQGLELKNLAPKTSYYHTFQTWDDEDFGAKFIVSFITTEAKDYIDVKTLQELNELLAKAEEDSLIIPKRNICWLKILASTPLYNTASKESFYMGLKRFLSVQSVFENDITFGPNNEITASRCHVYSNKADLMMRMRQVADASPAASFAYHPTFVIFEQYVHIVPDTLQTVGVTIAVMFVITCIFLPHPLMVILVTVQLFMIVVGIFGFMALWGLTLSSITMIEIIMSVGFSVDFCAHVCTAYMVSDELFREDRAKDAIIHASGPIFNGGLSTLIGVSMLIFSASYIFQSFFKIMLLVIVFGVLHAVFLVPVILSFIGPSTQVRLEQVNHVSAE